MSRHILRAGNTILKTGSNIFTVGDLRPPAAVIDPSVLLADGIADGAKVPIIRDQSGKGNHLYNSTLADQPTFIANAGNGNSAIRFDGITQYGQFIAPILFRTALVVYRYHAFNQGLISQVLYTGEFAFTRLDSDNTRVLRQNISNTFADHPHNKAYVNGTDVALKGLEKNSVFHLLTLDLGYAAYPANETPYITHVAFTFYQGNRLAIDLMYAELYDFRLPALARQQREAALIQRFGL